MSGISIEIGIEDNKPYVRTVTSTRKIRKKGKSLLSLLENYVVIDIETTGLDTYYNSIIEISALKIRNNEIVDKFTSLVKPDKYYENDECENDKIDYFEKYDYKFCYYVDDFITELTGINNSMLLNAPDTEEVLSKFFSFISDEDIIIGHNVNFDINFIYDAYLKYYNKNFKNDFVDNLRLSKKVLKDMKHHTLKDVAAFFNIPQDIEHRALADCETTYKCYEKLKQYIKENNIELKEYSAVKAKDITTENTEFDETSPVYQKVFVFTGTLENMTRRKAMQLVADNGGINGDGVTKKTNFLVLGNNDYCKAIKDGKSLKQKKAEKLILDGQDLKIISENVFYDMIEV